MDSRTSTQAPCARYRVRIEREVDGANPRDAAEQMWANLRSGMRPIVHVIDAEARVRVIVDLAREPGDHDVAFASIQPAGP